MAWDVAMLVLVFYSSVKGGPRASPPPPARVRPSARYTISDARCGLVRGEDNGWHCIAVCFAQSRTEQRSQMTLPCPRPR